MFEYNENTGNYVSLYGFPNIRAGVCKEVTDDDKKVVALNKYDAYIPGIVAHDYRNIEYLKDALRQLATAHPTWMFVIPCLDAMAYSMSERQIHVFCGKENLGRIWVDTRASNRCFAMSNERIKIKLHRGECIKTTDVKQVLKVVAKYFHPAKLDELLARSFDAVSISIRGVASGFSSEEYSVYRDFVFSDKVKAHVLENLTNILDGIGHVPSDKRLDPANLHTIESNKVVSANMQDAFGAEAGVLVRIVDGGRYVVAKDQEADPAVYAGSELPAYLKRAVGMLKLVSNTSILPEYGFKLDNNTYYVTAKEEIANE